MFISPQKIDQAMILAAGFGTRLLPLTLSTPKPLIPIAGTTCLKETISKLRLVGVKKIIVNTHHLAHKIHSYLENYADVIISHEEEILETGGGVLRALKYFGEEPFFCINGDVWWGGDESSTLEKMQQSWNPAKMHALLMIVPLDAALDCKLSARVGDYYLDNNNRLCRNPVKADNNIDGHPIYSPYIYSGVQILSTKVFKNRILKKSQTAAINLKFSLKEIYNEAEQRKKLFAVIHKGPWADIGSPNGLEETRKFLNTPQGSMLIKNA